MEHSDDLDIDVDMFRARILALKQELKELIEESVEDSKPVELDQTRVGRLSRMEAMQEQEMALEIANRRYIQMQRFDAALARMDEGEFGYCVVCGEDIEKARLEVDPAVPSCIVCASA